MQNSNVTESSETCIIATFNLTFSTTNNRTTQFQQKKTKLLRIKDAPAAIKLNHKILHINQIRNHT